MAKKKAKKTTKKKSATTQNEHPQQEKLVSSFALFKRTALRITQNWKTLLTLSVIFVFIQLLLNNTAAQSEQSGSIVALLLGALFSLMFIYVARESAREEKAHTVDLRKAAYRGPQQIVPFLLLSLLTIAQLLPFAIGAFIFQIAVPGGVAVFLWEQLIFGAIWIVLTLPSAYWLTTTIFALVIGAIPNVTPMQAWRASKKLVKPYLLQVMWRLIVAISLGLVFIGIVLYTAILASDTAEILTVVNVLFSLLLPLAWLYVFELYLELLAHEQN